MRLLLVSQYFWPETFSINALAKSLGEQGVEVTVLTGKPNYPDGQVFSGYSAWGVQRERFGDIEVIRLPLFPRGKNSSLRLMLNYLSFITAGFLFGPWVLRKRHFDAVFVYAPSPLLQALPAVWLAHLKRAPMAVWVQDLWPESLSATGFIKNRCLLGIVGRVVRFIYRHTDQILVPSEAFREPIQSLVSEPEKIRYCPNAWVDETSVGVVDETLVALAGEIASGFSVVFAGNLGIAQSLDTVIEAASRLQSAGSDARFFLVGSGSQSAWLAAEVNRLGLRNVRLPGRFPPAAMSQLYASASALLVSLRDEPIFAYTIPSKVQGYLAAGRPIIAAINGEGARVVTEAGAGFACPAGDAVALAEAVLKLSAINADARAEIGENGARYAAEHFSLNRLAASLVQQLRHLLAARQKTKDGRVR